MIIILILVISIATHFIAFGYPGAVVFDEVHNGYYLNNYWDGTYFFDVHPPLMKIVESFFGYLTGASHVQIDFSFIGNYLPTSITLLRLLPMIAGTILPIIIYLLLRKLDISKISAGMVAILIILENSLLVQSRFIVYDVIMLALGFLAILLYFQYETEDIKWRKYLLLAGSTVLAGVAGSIKWTGLSFLLVIFFLAAYNIWQKNKFWPFVKKMAAIKSLYLGVALIIYLIVFAVHFALLPKSGSGDAFMTANFQRTLVGNKVEGPNAPGRVSFINKFVELNTAMYKANVTMDAKHPYSSKWYTWPVMQRPIFYWQSNGDPAKGKAYIYLIGNPFIYWLSSVFMLFLIVLGTLKLFFKKITSIDTDQKKKLVFFLIAGYLINFLPFIFIGRVMFIYHYEAALVIAIMSIAFFIDSMSEKKKMIAFVTIISIALLAFIYWSPLTYGRPLSDEQFSSRMWLQSWR